MSFWLRSPLWCPSYRNWEISFWSWSYSQWQWYSAASFESWSFPNLLSSANTANVRPSCDPFAKVSRKRHLASSCSCTTSRQILRSWGSWFVEVDNWSRNAFPNSFLGLKSSPVHTGCKIEDRHKFRDATPYTACRSPRNNLGWLGLSPRYSLHYLQAVCTLHSNHD